MNIFKTLITIIIIACVPFSVSAEVRVNPDMVYNDGVAAFIKGDYSKASRLFNDAISHGLRDPQLSSARNKTAMISSFSDGPASRVWRTFVAGLESSDYPTAYNQMSSKFRAGISLDKFSAIFQKDKKATAYFERFVPGREENVDNATLLLHVYSKETGQLTGKPLRMLLEAGLWRIEDI